MDEKVYIPEEILDTPLPGEENIALNSAIASQKGSNEIVGPKTIKDSGIPRRVVSRETISASLNTKSKKILGEFQFTDSGALQIGKYTNGVHGDIRISPTGITARDSAGNTSFNLDGETGDAQFRGTIEANDFQITGGGIYAIALEGQRSLGGFGSIQEAINWVYSLGGGNVFLPGGVYEVTRDIQFYSNIKLIGEDDESTILDFMGTNARLLMGIVQQSPSLHVNIEFQHLQFRRRRDTALTLTNGVITSGANDLFIRECKFTDNWNASLSSGIDILTTGDKVLIEGCKFEDSGRNIRNLSDKVRILGCNFEDSLSDAIVFASGLRGVVNQNFFNGITGNAIATYSSGDDIQDIFINNNVITSNKGTAISIGSGVEASGWIISGNILSGVASPNSGDGIFMGSSALENQIIGNQINFFQDGDGIDVDGGDRNIILGNIIQNCSGYGVSLDANTANNQVHRNTFQNNGSGATQNLGTDNDLANMSI